MYNLTYRAFDVYENIKSGWKQDRDFLGDDVAAQVFDPDCLEGARSYAQRKHL